MAPRRRRATRSATKKSPEPSPEPSSGTPTQVEENIEAQQSHTQDDACPACKADESPLNAAEKESWVRCDACKTWYHWVCAGNGDDIEAVDKW
jgi:hypothetical protein